VVIGSACVPTLAVYPLSDAFADVWSELAQECGLDLDIVSAREHLGQVRGAVRLIAAGGAEEMLETTLRAIAATEQEVGAIGALPDHRLATSVMRAGAAEYFALPVDVDRLRSWTRERADRLRSHETRRDFAAAETAKYAFAGIYGKSDALRQTLSRAVRVIPHPNVTVLITGETGTGKELLARAIHYNGPRREAPFVDINCAAIPDQLLESELFGHEKGAFTDARTTKPGLFEVANGGTLFLDEIGHLALPLQGKILRALEERSIRRVGGAKSIPIDVRVIAATHVDLARAVKERHFREDLYHRLNVVPMHLPPLRERGEDVVPLARNFLAKLAQEYGVPEPRLSLGAQRALRDHSWTGNVRELRNAMERAILLSDLPELDASDLALDDSPGRPSHGGAIPFPATLAEVTRAAVGEMLDLCGGNKSEAARRLGISRPRLLRLMNGDTSTEVDPGDPDA
jgi:DNA-binding NtrC family response regulator